MAAAASESPSLTDVISANITISNQNAMITEISFSWKRNLNLKRSGFIINRRLGKTIKRN